MSSLSSRIEHLETRIAPATFVWDGSVSSDWFTPANWTPDGVPGAGDTASLDTDRTINLSTSTSVGVFQQSAGNFTFIGPAAVRLTVLQAFDWSGGSESGGTMVLAAGSTSTIFGTADKTFQSRILDNFGTLVWKDTGTILMPGSTITNRAGAVFDVQTDADLVVLPGTPAGIFNNAGILRKSSGTGVTEFPPQLSVPITVTNTGTLDVQTGIVRFNAPVTNAGTFQASSGAGIDVLSDFTVSDGAQFIGPGPTRLVTGTTTADGTIASGPLVLDGAVLMGTQTLAGGLRWINGTIGSGGTTTIPAGSVLTLNNVNQVSLDGRTLDNAGTILLQNVGAISMPGSTIINRAGAFFDVQTDADLFVPQGPDGFFNNAGTFLKSGGTGVTEISPTASPQVTFTNTGAVEIETGTVRFQTFTQTAGTTSLEGGNLAGTLNFSGGVLIGTGTLNANVNNNGAVVRPGGSAVAALTIVGDYTQSSGGTLELQIGGPSAGVDFDVLSVGTTATLDGTLNVTLTNGFIPPIGSQYQILNAPTRAGTFATENKPASLTTQYTNSAVVLAALSLQSTVTVTTPLDIINSDDGVVSLREAINFANGTQGVDTITFDIPGTGVQTIELASPLPALTEAVVIDGYTQPGASSNQLIDGNNALPLIELSGAGANVLDGIVLNGGNSIVRGLIINGFAQDGVVINGPGDDIVAGNWIGVSSTGLLAKANRDDGIQINAPNVTIGGLNPADRNVISGNGQRGIELSGGVGGMIVQGNFIGTNAIGTVAVGNGEGGIRTGTFNINSPNVVIGGSVAGARNVISGNLEAGIHVQDSIGGAIVGNYIGTDISGTLAIGNGTGVILNTMANALVGGDTPAERNIISGNNIQMTVLASQGSTIIGNYLGVGADGSGVIGGGTGIHVAGSSGTEIGGPSPGDANVISGHGGPGILITNNSSSNSIEGNFIGTDATGVASIGNQVGINVVSASSILIGGGFPAVQNVIAFNDFGGIIIHDPSRGVSILGNSIRDNNGLGIDLGDDGVTANDVGDADMGANGLQNFPVLASATVRDGDVIINGTLNSTADTVFTLRFYGSPDADPTGFGEGAIYLGSTNVTSDSSGNATFGFTATVGLSPNSQITATAANGSRDTSEFSEAVVLQQNSTPGGKSVSVTEADGDRVTIKVNKGSIPDNAIVMGPNGIELIDLRAVGSGLAKATITIVAEQSGGGDGLVNVGAINASGIDLSKIRVDGDLGQIDIGSGDPRKPALKSLSVASLGTQGASTQTPGTQNPLLSEVNGSLGELNVKRDVQNAVVNASGKIGKVLIGGNLIDNAPALAVERRLPSIGVFLNGGIPPPNASHAGAIFAPDIGSVTVMGDIDGGEIGAETAIKKVKIVGKLMSDDPLDPAILRVGAAIAKVVINGDVENALILAGYNRALEPNNPDAAIGKVTVKGNWTASSLVAGIADPGDNGFGLDDAIIPGDDTPDVFSRITKVIIKGSASGSATLSDRSALTAQKLGAVEVNGAKIPLTGGRDDVRLDPLRENFRAVEV